MNAGNNPHDALELIKIRNHMAAMIAIKGTDCTLKEEEVKALLPLLEKAFEQDSSPDTGRLFGALATWLAHKLPDDLDNLIKKTLLSADLNSPSDLTELITIIYELCSTEQQP